MSWSFGVLSHSYFNTIAQTFAPLISTAGLDAGSSSSHGQDGIDRRALMSCFPSCAGYIGCEGLGFAVTAWESLLQILMYKDYPVVVRQEAMSMAPRSTSMGGSGLDQSCELAIDETARTLYGSQSGYLAP